MSTFKSSLSQLKRAIARVKEVLDEPKSDIVRDSAVQRFEFTLDLAWKTVKLFLEEKKGMVCSSPKDCFREAYRQGLIEYDADWLKFIDLRNETAHIYKEELADNVYIRLPDILAHFEKLLVALEK